MGTFGCGNFASDIALDWLEGFRQARRVATLAKTLKQWKAGKAEAEAVLACAEMVAAMNGYPSDELDPEIEEWAHKSRAKLTEELRQGARAAVEQIAAGSELRDLWGETEELDAWLAVQRDLLERLERPQREGPPERRPPVVRLWGTESGMEPRRLRLSSEMPDLGAELPGVGEVRGVALDLAGQPTDEEMHAFATWVSRWPEIEVQLTDWGHPRGFALAPSWLRALGSVRRLSLQAETARSVEDLARLRQLESLQLRFVRAPHPLRPLTGLPELRELGLLEVDPKRLLEEVGLLGELHALRALSVEYFTPKLDLDELPPLPAGLRALSLKGVSIAQVERLGELSGLRRLSLRGVRLGEGATSRESPGRAVRLAVPEGVQDLELSGVQGVREIQVPRSVARLVIHEVGEARLAGAEAWPHLLVVEAALPLLGRLDRLAASSRLRRIEVPEAPAAELLAMCRGLRELEALYLDCAGQPLPSLEGLPALRRISLSGCRVDLDFAAMAGLRRLEEICLSFDEWQPDLSPERFAPLAAHPKLRVVQLLGMFEDPDLRSKVDELLGLGRAGASESVLVQISEEVDRIVGVDGVR